MKIEVTGIRWEIDYIEELGDLPDSTVVEVSDELDRGEIDEAIAEELTNQFEMLHDGFESYEIISS